MRQTRRLRIDAPVERVWELIDDDAKVSTWMPNIVATRYPGGKPKDNPVGARFIQEMRQGDRIDSYEGEVTEYERGRLLARIAVSLGVLSPADVRVQLWVAPAEGPPLAVNAVLDDVGEGRGRYVASVQLAPDAPLPALAARALPRHPFLSDPYVPGLIRWSD